MTTSPRTKISPCSPEAAADRPGGPIRTSTPVKGWPHERQLEAASFLAVSWPGGMTAIVIGDSPWPYICQIIGPKVSMASARSCS